MFTVGTALLVIPAGSAGHNGADHVSRHVDPGPTPAGAEVHLAASHAPSAGAGG